MRAGDLSGCSEYVGVWHHDQLASERRSLIIITIGPRTLHMIIQAVDGSSFFFPMIDRSDRGENGKILIILQLPNLALSFNSSFPPFACLEGLFQPITWILTVKRWHPRGADRRFWIGYY